jgi:hypothetical protein
MDLNQVKILLVPLSLGAQRERTYLFKPGLVLPARSFLFMPDIKPGA